MDLRYKSASVYRNRWKPQKLLNESVKELHHTWRLIVIHLQSAHILSPYDYPLGKPKQMVPALRKQKCKQASACWEDCNILHIWHRVLIWFENKALLFCLLSTSCCHWHLHCHHKILHPQYIYMQPNMTRLLWNASQRCNIMSIAHLPYWWRN